MSARSASSDRMKKRIASFIAAILLLGLASIPTLRSSETKVLDQESRKSTSGKFVRLSQGWTHYEFSGSETGDLVVLVHGFSIPYFIWDGVQEALVSAGFRVLRFDLYGRGASDRPGVKYDLDLFDNQLEELVRELNIREPFHIMGLSMGGAITAKFVGKRPERIKKVILIDPFSSKAEIFPLNVPGIGEYVSASYLIPALPERQKGDFLDLNKIPVSWKEKYRQQMQFKGFGAAILSTLRNLLSLDPRPQYESLARAEKKVLLVWGKQDRTTPLETGSYVRELLKPTFLLVEESGHLPHIEKPEIVIPAILNFL